MEGPAAPAAPAAPPPLLAKVERDEAKLTEEDAGGFLDSEPTLSKSSSPIIEFRQAVYHHHEVMLQWMAKVEKQLRVLQDVTERNVGTVSERTSMAHRRSQPQLTVGSQESEVSKTSKKVGEQPESSRSFGDFTEAQKAAKQAIRQDILWNIPDAARSSKRKPTKGRASPQILPADSSRQRRGSSASNGSDDDSGTCSKIQVPIPEIPGTLVFDARSGEKTTERPFDSVLSAKSMSPCPSQPMVASNSWPERPTGDSSASSAWRMLDNARVRTLPPQPAANEWKDSVQQNASNPGTPRNGAFADSPRRTLGGSDVARAASQKSSQSVPASLVLSQENEDGSKMRSRRQSVEKLDIKRMVSSGNLTEVFKKRERELTAQLSPHHEDVVGLKEAASRIFDDETTVCDMPPSKWLLLRPLEKLVSRSLSKLFGLLPLVATHPQDTSEDNDDKTDTDSTSEASDIVPMRCPRFVHCAGAMYHFLIVLMVFMYMGHTIVRVGRCEALQICSLDLDWPGMASDTAVSLGAFVMLLCWGGLKYKERTQLTSQSMQDLVDALVKKSLDEAFEVWACSDSLMVLLFWGVVLGGRWTLLYFEMAQEDSSEDPWRYVVFAQELGHFLSTGVVLLTSYWQVRTSHAMTLIVNAWVEPFLNNEVSCDHLRSEWRSVSGLFRKTSRTFQHCCATVAFMSVLLMLAVLYDLRQGHILLALPNILLGLCLPGVLLIHASTTTACKRLPSLVMLWEPSEGSNEREYMDLALFVSMSECGFFIWDTCLTLGLVQKFLYFTVAMAGTLGFNSGVLKLSS